jgi:hypothetical protein
MDSDGVFITPSNRSVLLSSHALRLRAFLQLNLGEVMTTSTVVFQGKGITAKRSGLQESVAAWLCTPPPFVLLQGWFGNQSRSQVTNSGWRRFPWPWATVTPKTVDETRLVLSKCS